MLIIKNYAILKIILGIFFYYDIINLFMNNYVLI
jgi:hypothetical protein